MPLPTEDDVAFLAALRRAGVTQEFDDRALGRAVAGLPPGTRGEERRIGLLTAYYEAGGDLALAATRRTKDRFFCHADGEAATAQQLVARLAAVAPEVRGIVLERIGGGADAQLVLRAGDVIAAVVDDYEESLETNEVDLREVDEGNGPTVTIRGLVRALNTHLARVSVRERLVPLRTGDTAEVYVAVGMRDALDLAGAGLLEDEDPEELLELCGW